MPVPEQTTKKVPLSTWKVAQPTGRPRRNAVTSLQQTAGNRAVANLMARKPALRQPHLGTAPGARRIGGVGGMGGVLASLTTLRNMENHMMRSGGLTMNALNARRAMMMEMFDQLEAHIVRSRGGGGGTGRNRYGQMGQNVGGGNSRNRYGQTGRNVGGSAGRTYGYGEMSRLGGGGMGHSFGQMGGRSGSGSKNLSPGRSSLAKLGIFESGTGLGGGSTKRVDPDKVQRENQKVADDVGLTIKESLGSPGIEAWKKVRLPKDRKEMLKSELNSFLVDQVRGGAFKTKVADKRVKDATNDIISQVLRDWQFTELLKNVDKASVPELVQGRVWEAMSNNNLGTRFK